MKSKQIISLLLLLTVLSTLILPVSATLQPVSDSNYNDFSLEWNRDTVSNQDLLMEVSTSDAVIQFAYDDYGHRTGKFLDNSSTNFEYSEDGRLLSEWRNGHQFVYNYEPVNELDVCLVSFTLNGTTYFYKKDENQSVVAILDEYNQEVARYDYDKGIVTNVYGLDENGEWTLQNDNLNFIGNLNLIRLYSYYYDSETGWYYYDRYYDPQNMRFVDGHDSTMKPRMSVDAETEWLLNQSFYGRPLSYSSSWYSTLSTVELLARLIYGENTKYEADQNAIGYSVLNRYHGNDGYNYPSRLDLIITQDNQFSAITYDATSTQHARQPQTTSSGWKHATYVAVAIVQYYQDISICETYFYRPRYMDYQTQFVAYSHFLLNARDGRGCIQYNINGSWNDLKDVIIPGVGTYTDLASLRHAYKYDFVGESNIHFGYK